MPELDADQIRSLDESLQRALDNPMPPELQNQIRDLIEPHTINMELKHSDVMECIDVAFPVIRDTLLVEPEAAIRQTAERAARAAIDLATNSPYPLAVVVDAIRVFTLDEHQRRVAVAADAWFDDSEGSTLFDTVARWREARDAH